MRSNRVRVSATFLCSFLLASVLLVGLFAAVASAQDGPDRNILILIDESGSTRGTSSLAAMDPDRRRIHFAEFLVKYLQTFYPQEASIGITGFVSDTLAIVPMTRAESWAQADFASITPKLDSLYRDQFSPQGEPLRTRFSAVLRDASKGFEVENCVGTEGEKSRCTIVLFSDGLWGLEDVQELQNQLEALDKKGIQVVVALFAGDLTLDELSISDDIRDNGGWEFVRNTWARAGIVENTVISNSTTLPSYEVYEQIVEALEVAEPLKTLSRTVIIGSGVISLTIPAHTRSAQVKLLPDSQVQESWSQAPDIVAGNERWWLDPPPGVLEATVSSPVSSTDSAVVYFSADDSQYPVQFHAQALPEKLLVGSPIQLVARFIVNGQAITNTSGLGVDVVIKPGDVSFPLKPSAEGIFSATWIAPISEVYTAIFTPVSNTRQDWLSEVAPEMYSFLVAAAPEIALSVGDPVSQTTYYAIPVTVTVKVYTNLAATVHPSLEMLTATASQSLSLTLVTNTPDNTDIYTSELKLKPNSAAELRASLPAGYTQNGVAYEAKAAKQNFFVSNTESIRSFPQWIVAGLIASLAIVLALLLFGRLWRARGQQQKAFIENVQDSIALHKSGDELANLFRKPYSVNSEWSNFAYEFAFEILQSYDAIRTSS